MTSADPTLTDAAQRVGAFLDVLEKMAGPNLHGERLSDLVHHEHGHVTLLASDLRVILGAALAATSPPAPRMMQGIWPKKAGVDTVDLAATSPPAPADDPHLPGTTPGEAYKLGYEAGLRDQGAHPDA